MSSRPPTARVYGPAYLDRVLRVGGPLHRPGLDRPLDRSVVAARIEEAVTIQRTLVVRGSDREVVVEDLPDDWPGPSGTIVLESSAFPADRRVRAVTWLDDLGGMGAGYAAALGGELVCPLGGESDPTTRAVLGLLAREEIRSAPTYTAGVGSDWTLLITSGEHGDKLPIGFRPCLPSAREFPEFSEEIDLVVVAGQNNRLARSAVAAGPARLRLLAPSIRNMRDNDPPLAVAAEGCHVLACNAEEWMALEGREAVAAGLDLVVITEGPRGARLSFRGEDGSHWDSHIPAFPRSQPPVDTNRAGEAFASTLLLALWSGGWRGGPLSHALAESAARRASAAAALVLDWPMFGFPSPEAVDRALRAGRVE